MNRDAAAIREQLRRQEFTHVIYSWLGLATELDADIFEHVPASRRILVDGFDHMPKSLKTFVDKVGFGFVFSFNMADTCP